MVHWPEVMVTFDETTRTLFSADAFGTFGAMNGAIFADEVDFDNEYMDEALAESDLEKSYELWKNAQWDGTSGITQDGDLPWIWLVNIDHLYWVKDGLQVAEQKLHPHGHGWSIVNNVDQWTWK